MQSQALGTFDEEWGLPSLGRPGAIIHCSGDVGISVAVLSLLQEKGGDLWSMCRQLLNVKGTEEEHPDWQHNSRRGQIEGVSGEEE